MACGGRRMHAKPFDSEPDSQVLVEIERIQISKYQLSGEDYTFIKFTV
jgi:hypothetical protein